MKQSCSSNSDCPTGKQCNPHTQKCATAKSIRDYITRKTRKLAQGHTRKLTTKKNGKKKDKYARGRIVTLNNKYWEVRKRFDDGTYGLVIAPAMISSVGNTSVSLTPNEARLMLRHMEKAHRENRMYNNHYKGEKMRRVRLPESGSALWKGKNTVFRPKDASSSLQQSLPWTY